MSESRAFELLDRRIQRFLHQQGWSSLRDAQERAIAPILAGESDVIISAATAAGKTEAAFLPALTRLCQDEEALGLIVYISPLKALINDQFGRLDQLCESLEVPVWPWHGDISQSVKQKFAKRPAGVLLITPESLEAMLCNRGTAVAALFAGIRYIVVDELHAFIGSERGKQLQSLMHRIELLLQRKVPRIGLSATLGDMELAKSFLRRSDPAGVELIHSKNKKWTLQIQLRGYADLPAPEFVVVDAESEDEANNTTGTAITEVAKHLYRAMRGSNNLVFPNSRAKVEHLTAMLQDICAQDRVPNEFWPHHGSLSKEIRTDTEQALKSGGRPATAICTNTLELGIDIGAVKCVGQIGPPPSVSSLRQRLGRSGRREGEPAILRGYCIECDINDANDIEDRLRLSTVRMIAMIELMLEGWCEPPAAQGLHCSTLVQQLLSLISQYGGVTAAQAYQWLCAPGAPFDSITSQQFIQLLRHLGQLDFLTQDSAGVLLAGQAGERELSHYSFYASFATPEEYRILANGRQLGTMPVTNLVLPGQRLLFAGRRWLVQSVDDDQKVISVTAATGGKAPTFDGTGSRVHGKVQAKVRQLLSSSEPIAYLDQQARQFLDEARKAYADLQLQDRVFMRVGSEWLVLTWLGDDGNDALACMLMHRGLTATVHPLGVAIAGSALSKQDIDAVLTDIAAAPIPVPNELLAAAAHLAVEKWDGVVPRQLLEIAYASRFLDTQSAHSWVKITVKVDYRETDTHPGIST